MSDHRGGSPAYALRPPSEGAMSGAKLVAPRSETGPGSPSESGAVALPKEQGASERTGDGQWGELATAPTLLITPREAANDDGDDSAASTTRIATPAATPADPAWFRSGNTVPPPSMRPPAESAPTLAEKRAPNPRVVKIVGGVIGACLFIVAVASVKILYQRAAAAGTRAPEEATSASLQASKPEPVAVAAPPAPTAAEKTAPSEPTARPAAPAAAQTTTHAAPAHAPSPARVTPKSAPRRAPVTKKVVRH